MFLPGYMSDMAGSKAAAVFEAARADGRECLLFDYSGCGESSGAFAQGTLSRWRDEALALTETCLTAQHVILIGSSMGGWLMLLVGLALEERLAGLVGIASAPDFSEWGYEDCQKSKLARDETIYEANPYGPEPTPTHASFWHDAQSHLLLAQEIAITCPVRLLHGTEDDEVPWRISLDMSRTLASNDVSLTLVKDGDHRLSRPREIALLMATIMELTRAARAG